MYHLFGELIDIVRNPNNTAKDLRIDLNNEIMGGNQY